MYEFSNKIFFFFFLIDTVSHYIEKIISGIIIELVYGPIGLF